MMPSVFFDAFVTTSSVEWCHPMDPGDKYVKGSACRDELLYQNTNRFVGNWSPWARLNIEWSGKKKQSTDNWPKCIYIYMGVSENSGTPKSSILTGFSIINHPFWEYHHFWKHPYIYYRKMRKSQPAVLDYWKVSRLRQDHGTWEQLRACVLWPNFLLDRIFLRLSPSEFLQT